MRLYLIHRKYYLDYLRAQKAVEQIVDEQEILMQRLQPKSSLSEHEREHLPSNPTGGGGRVNKAEEYVISMEQLMIKARLAEAKAVLNNRKILLDQKEEELRKSKDIYNIIYTLKWVDNLKPELIIQESGYSRSQVYNIINQLTAQLERSNYDEGTTGKSE